MKNILLSLTIFLSFSVLAFEIEDNLSNVIKVKITQDSFYQLLLLNKIERRYIEKKLGNEDLPHRLVLKSKTKIIKVFKITSSEYSQLKPYFKKFENDPNITIEFTYNVDLNSNNPVIEKISFGNR